MARELTEEEKQEYDQLTENMEQMRLRLEELDAVTSHPTIYGYARVSTFRQAKGGNSLEDQKERLRAAGAEEIYRAQDGSSTVAEAQEEAARGRYVDRNKVGSAWTISSAGFCHDHGASGCRDYDKCT